ncbi:MAG TPA: SDR family oxidoreductase [Bacteroidia bacterium]|jgi:3-oxoacyl-[acyl-carrier protein] reductase|nr:SDR family oxidoreductase [Bacteroidia bacterium]
MNLDLTGKHALVCGSTQGIGKAAALELAALGADVTLLARNEPRLKTAVAELGGKGKHNYIVADFSDPAKLKNTIDDFLKKEKIIHILVNNTGGPPGGPITEAKTEEFVSAFSNHLLCNHILAQAVLPGMKSAKYGRIINVISTSVKIPLKGLGVSNTIRAAVGNWAKTLSLEVAPFGITVNNVLPGATSTQRLASIIETKSQKTNVDQVHIEKEMIAEIPAGRFGAPEEVAAAIAFLATPAAAYINGINVPVDGGRTGNL